MHTYPADERRISEVEQGRSSEAMVPLPPCGSLLVGDAVLFAQAMSHGGHSPRYVRGGDSVLVSLTEVTDLGATDPDTERPLVRIAWEPLGQFVPPATGPRRGSKAR